MAYFDTIYANAMHESVNKQSMREQGDVRLTRGEARLWKRLCELCEKQGIDPNYRRPFMRAPPRFWT